MTDLLSPTHSERRYRTTPPIAGNTYRLRSWSEHDRAKLLEDWRDEDPDERQFLIRARMIQISLADADNRPIGCDADGEYTLELCQQIAELDSTIVGALASEIILHNALDRVDLEKLEGNSEGTAGGGSP